MLLPSWKSSHWFVLPVSVAVKFPETISLLKKRISAHLSSNLLVLHFKICHLKKNIFLMNLSRHSRSSSGSGDSGACSELREFGSD